MTASAIELLIEAQSDLIAALDSGNVAAIEDSTQAMAAAVEKVRAQDAWRDTADLPKLDYAMKQSQAARMRINYLSDWTRQKIDRLFEIRGGARASKPQLY
jgi:hypothetical protein